MRFLKSTRVVVGAIVAAAWIVAGPIPTAEVIEQVLVKVNGEIFTKTDLEARQVAAVRQMGQNLDLKNSQSDAQLRKLLDETTPQLIVGVVDEMLVVQRGHELGYKMGDEQFQGILDSIKKDNKIESDEQFQAALKQENMTLVELRKNLERQMIFSRVQQNEVLGKIAVNEEEARKYYDTHLSEFTSPQSVTLREIFVSIPGDASATVADDTAAKDKATDIRRRALAGESFEKLAADLSESPSRANAGLIGPLSVTDVSADVRTLIEPMKVGDLTEVLRNAKGYQLLKLESKSAAEAQPFAQAREDISNRVFTGKRQAEFQKYLEKLRAEAIVEWKNADLKKAYDLGVEQAKLAATTIPATIPATTPPRP